MYRSPARVIVVDRVEPQRYRPARLAPDAGARAVFARVIGVAEATRSANISIVCACVRSRVRAGVCERAGRDGTGSGSIPTRIPRGRGDEVNACVNERDSVGI